jgi:LysM repeat protein
VLLLSNTVFSQESFIKHKVEKGETITQIAKEYSISKNEIIKLNAVPQDVLKENEIIFIPNNDLYRIHHVEPKETLFSITSLYDITVEELKKLNPEITDTGIKINQKLRIPKEKAMLTDAGTVSTKGSFPSLHIVQPKETLFGIARLYNVSVQDLDNLNKEKLEFGLRIGEKMALPNKKKTIDGKVRVINATTIFHLVEAKETKFSIAKKYGITIDQLESQNPEIINGLKEGNKLAINIKSIQPTNDKEELMMALAEKQVALEKSKAIVAENYKLKTDKSEADYQIITKQNELDLVKDSLTVQKKISQKVIRINALKVNLNEIDDKKAGSVEKLKLVLEANKNIQELLLSKLDSIVYTMQEDVEKIKNQEVTDIENIKRLEEQSYQNIAQTNTVLQELKKDLADTRKNYAGIMNKVQIITLEENKQYKKKVREGNQKNGQETLGDIKKIEFQQLQNDKKNTMLLSRIDSLSSAREAEFKRKIKQASFYSEESRNYDDELALEKIKRYKKNAKPAATKEEIKVIKNETATDNNTVNIQVIKNIDTIKAGYYFVLGIFNEPAERDRFIMQLIDYGQPNATFFYNVNRFSYYVYTKVYPNVQEALKAYKQKEGTKYHENLLIVRVEKEQ